MIGSRLQDRYLLSAELGRGGMGVVFEAWDPRLNREVAVKVILPDNLDDEIEERFQREARVVAQLDHPGIVPIYDFGRHRSSLFFVMPRLQGDVLRDLIRERTLDVDEILQIAVQIADALDHSHAQGVVHRDVKPGNVMVSREDGQLRVRVMDFGLARPATEASLSGSVTAIGTPLYLSPEQIVGDTLDGRSDLYSLGALLYECLAGETPFTGDLFSVVYRIVNEQPRSLRNRGVDVDEELDGIVMSCLAKVPAGRPGRGRDLAAALTDHLMKLRRSATASVVLTTKPAKSPAQAVALPLVGRGSELAELRSRLDAALGGECQMVLVGGETGIGKTRLLQELENQARVSQVRVLRSRFADWESALPYQGFCELIHDYFRAHKVDSREAGAASDDPDFPLLAADLVAHFPALSEIRELREAARPGAPGERAGALAAEPTAQLRFSFLFELLARALAWLAGGRPMVLLLDHLHEAEASLEALRYVFYRLGPSPLLIVGTYRETEIDRGHPLARLLRSWNDEPRVGSLVLKPLEVTAFRDLLKFQVGGPELDERLVRKLYDTAEGNPYFGIELVRSYRDTGSLRCDESGVWRLSEDAADHALPKTIRQTVEARIERLGPGLRHLLSLASVLGKTFEYKDLEQLIAGLPERRGDRVPQDLDEALDELVSHGLLEEGRRTRGDWLSFSSGVVREALYRNLPRRRRRSLHRRHALELEERHAGRLDRVYPRLVYHFSVGAVAEKTVEYAMKLAQQSLAAWSPGEAVQAVGTALELVGEVDNSSRLEGELRELLAHAHRAAGDDELALREAARAADAFEAAKMPDRKVRVVLLAAETAWQVRRVEEVATWVSRGVALARHSGVVDVLERLLLLGATVANLRGAYAEATRYLGEADQIFVASGTFQVVTGKDLAQAEELAPRGGELVTALRNPVVNLDPGAIKTFEEQEIAANTFETLVVPDADGNLVPWLCQGWQASDDTRSYVVTLRPGVCFSDGRPLSARAVKASFERSAQCKAYSPPVALTVIEGLSDFLAGTAADIRGIEVVEEERRERLRFQLTESLPIFPATLTDPKIAISHDTSDDPRAVAPDGTGPFKIVRHEAGLYGPGCVVLERNPRYWRGVSAHLEKIRFLTSREAPEITDGLRAEDIDLAWDLSPDDLEDVLRDPRFRSGWSEVTTRNVYFALFNHSGPAARGSEGQGEDFLRLRQTLFESVRIHDLVWRTLGRFAQPAPGLIPPGIFGHNAGRRRFSLALDEAEKLNRASGLRGPVTLTAAIHPFFRDRFSAFLGALFEVWSHLGVEVVNATPTLRQYISRWGKNDDVDLLIGRWNGDYEDPDSYTYALFHSVNGVLRQYYSSADTDLLMELARHERQPDNRRTLYWNVEALLDEHYAVLPLFYDVDCRIAGPRVRGFRLGNTRPSVNYSEVGKAETAATAAASRPQEAWNKDGGEIHVPVPTPIDVLDPLRGGFADQLEVTSNIFETLTRIDEGARAVAGLASSFEVLPGGRVYRFELLSDVRFHDGRRLTARDVRHTYERVLTSPGHDMGHLLLPIRGARALRDGEASGLAGLRILSATELVFELERPLELFPALLAQAGLAIVPEGKEPGGTSWRDGIAGTGPFRVVRFAPGERLELERNPHYRRSDIPRSERLVFHFGVSPGDAVEGLRQGRFSLASRLRSADVADLRRDPELARCGFEAPGLSTWFLALNACKEPLDDPDLRRALVASLSVRDCVQETFGRRGTFAKGLIPPGLLGSLAPHASPETDDTVSDESSSSASHGILAERRGRRLEAAVHAGFSVQYAAFWEKLRARFRKRGIPLDVTWGKRPEATERAFGSPMESFDLVIDHWYAYYPDADSFAMDLLHSEEGHYGRFLRSPELDRLSEEGRWERDPAARDAIYREIESTLARDALVVPLFYEQTHHFRHPRVRGFRTGFPFPMVRYERLTTMP